MSAEANSETTATYRIDPDRRMLVITCVGKIGPAHIAGMQARWPTDPAFDPSFGMLFDGSQADLTAFSADSIRQIATNTPFNADAPRAFLVDQGLHFGLARMFQSFSEASGSGTSVQIFHDLDTAMAWLAGKLR